ncbi:hypothetical protein D3C76_1154000 [compost metagenome]
MMQLVTQRGVSVSQRLRFLLIHNVILRQQFQNAHVIRPARQLRLVVRMAEHQILRNEFNVGNPAFIGFDIKAIAVLVAQMRPHFLTHFSHVDLQFLTFARRNQHVPSNGIELRFQLRIAVHHAGTHQRLMLPCPGFVLLIVSKGFGGRD